jgi:Tfp pilus assembly protein PilF
LKGEKMQGKIIKDRNRKRFYEMLNKEKREQAERTLIDIKKHMKEITADHDLYVHLGMAELLVGKPENALTAAKEALCHNEVSYLAWYVLGCAYLDMRELTRAQRAYEEAVRLRPQDMPENLDRGLMADLFDSLQIIETLRNK